MSNTTPTTTQLSNNALNVHLGFAVLFFGIGAVQQFTTVWFNSISQPAVGKTALLLLYTSFFFASIFSHRFVEILGVKRCFMLSTVVYAAFILTLCLANPVAIYVAAILCGLSASTLWTAFFFFLNSIEDVTQRKRESGRFWRFYYLGTCLGILTLNVLRDFYGYQIAFCVFGLIALSAIFVFNRMTMTASAGSRVVSGSIRRWRLVIALAFTTWSSRIIYGLVIASVPMDVALYADAAYVGWISAPFFFIPILLSDGVSRLMQCCGTRNTAVIGFVFSLSGLACYGFVPSTLGFGLGILLTAVGSSMIYPVGSVLPGILADVQAGSIARLSSFFSLASSAGTMCGLLIVNWLVSPWTYRLSLCLSAISLMLFLLYFPRQTTGMRETGQKI